MVPAFSKAIILFQQKPKIREDEKNQYVKMKRKFTDANNNEEYLEKTLYCLHQDYDPQELLALLQQFADARIVMNWTRGPQLFSNFIALLGNSTRAANTWRDLAIAAPQSLDGFDAAILDFKTVLLSCLKYDKQLTYMRNLKKPGPCSVQDFHRDFFDLNQLSTKFPDANGRIGLDATEFKNCFFEAMPIQWQHSFHKANQQVSASTVDDIAQYMDQIEELDQYDPKRSSPNNYDGNETSATSNNYNGNETSATSTTTMVMTPQQPLTTTTTTTIAPTALPPQIMVTTPQQPPPTIPTTEPPLHELSDPINMEPSSQESNQPTLVLYLAMDATHGTTVVAIAMAPVVMAPVLLLQMSQRATTPKPPSIVMTPVFPLNILTVPPFSRREAKQSRFSSP